MVVPERAQVEKKKPFIDLINSVPLRQIYGEPHSALLSQREGSIQAHVELGKEAFSFFKCTDPFPRVSPHPSFIEI